MKPSPPPAKPSPENGAASLCPRARRCCIGSRTESRRASRIFFSRKSRTPENRSRSPRTLTSPEAPRIFARLRTSSRPPLWNHFALRLPTASSRSIMPSASLSASSELSRRGICRSCCRSEEHTSELQSHHDLVCRLLLEKKKKKKKTTQQKKKKKTTDKQKKS